MNFRMHPDLTYPGLDAEWLAERFRLFERFTVPSMRAQRAPHEWIVLFHPDTPEPWRTRIAAWEQEGLLVPLWLREYSIEEVVNFLKRRIGSETEWVISTRLDNDDGIHRDYLAAIQREANARGACYLNFSEGLQVEDGKVFPFHHRSNAFISRQEGRDSIRTVWNSLSHVVIWEDPKCVQIAAGRWWLQVVHGGNVSNVLMQNQWRHPVASYVRDFPGLGLDCLRRGVKAVLCECLFTVAWGVQKGLGRVRRAIIALRRTVP